RVPWLRKARISSGVILRGILGLGAPRERTEGPDRGGVARSPGNGRRILEPAAPGRRRAWTRAAAGASGRGRRRRRRRRRSSRRTAWAGARCARGSGASDGSWFRGGAWRAGIRGRGPLFVTVQAASASRGVISG